VETQAILQNGIEASEGNCMKRFLLTAVITSLFAAQASHGQEPANSVSPLSPVSPVGSVKRDFRPDMRKSAIEMPIKTLLVPPQELKSEPVSIIGSGTKNDTKKDPKKKVRPGAVIWYPTTADAKKNSLLSGKPVLVFHLMGFLDDRFC